MIRTAIYRKRYGFYISCNTAQKMYRKREGRTAFKSETIKNSNQSLCIHWNHVIMGDEKMKEQISELSEISELVKLIELSDKENTKERWDGQK